MQQTILFFSLLLVVLCFFSICSAMVYLLFSKITDPMNQQLQHPYLQYGAFKQLPLGLRMAILSDYFFRLYFPNGKRSLIGEANRILSHVDPKKVSSKIKTPLLILWGSFFIGVIAFFVMWTMIFIMR